MKYTYDPYDKDQHDHEGQTYCPDCDEYIDNEDFDNHNCQEDDDENK